MYDVRQSDVRLASYVFYQERWTMQIPNDIKSYTQLAPWWRTQVPTRIVLSADGVGDILTMLEKEGKDPFFVIDGALERQPQFGRLFAMERRFVFDATFSEPRTCDVDRLRSEIIAMERRPDTIVGVGGGATMDLAKAVAICMANPEPSERYQGYGLDMRKGAGIWVLPTLNGTGAEITPIAVLRGPKKKLGINNPYAEAETAVIDPQLSSGAPKFNRFFTMMDCYFHHYEIKESKTSMREAVMDAEDGLRLSREVLTRGLADYDLGNAIKSAMASVLGGSSTIGGRVGAAHAISYGLSNSAPRLPHGVAVTIAMLALWDIYPEGYEATRSFLRINGMEEPKASDYGIGAKDAGKMTETALGMDKLWHSCFGDGWETKATAEYIGNIYKRIIERK